MKILVATAAALMAISTAPAMANEARSVEVSYSDLNIRTAAGQKALESRIRVAAKKACNVGTGRDLATIARDQQCLKVAMRSAQTQLAAAGIGISLAAR